MTDYIVLFGLIFSFILFCILCHKRSSIFIIGLLWFAMSIIRKISWIYHIKQLTDPSIDIFTSQFQAKLSYSSYIMDLLMYLKFVLFAAAIVVFFIKTARKN